MLFDVLVIGAGQAGLAAAYHLGRGPNSFVVLDGAARVGDSWRRRYACLTLFTPRRFSSLPGLKMPGDPEGYADRDEFAAYLEDYARHWKLPVQTETRVVELSREAGGLFAATTRDGRVLRARSIIVATGAFMEPAPPPIAKDFDPAIIQLDVAKYQAPDGVPPGTALVVGDGASGRDIAMELAPTRRTLLASGKPRRLLPESLLGRNVWWWLSRLGLMTAGANSLVGRVMRRADPFPSRGRAAEDLGRAGVKLRPRLVGAKGQHAVFADGRTEQVQAIIWATGYRDRFDWLEIDGALSAVGSPMQTAGISVVPGLFFLGRPWQRNRASSLIMGAGEDASIVVYHALTFATRQA